MNADEHRSIIVVPASWSALDFASLRGVLLVVGAPNTGKSTFAHWLFERLAQSGQSVAFLDGDVGQSVLGPPTTLTLALPSQPPAPNLQHLHLRQSEVQVQVSLTSWFIGDVSPRGRMLPLVVGAGRLARRALEAGAATIVVDTTGLVDPAHGGVALKHALVDQLQPAMLFALQQVSELEPILAPLRKLIRPRVVEFPVSDAVRWRGVEARQAYRAGAFRRYFAGAGTIRLSLRGRAIFDGRAFAPQRLLALQDADGFALALGVVVAHNEARDELHVCTPITGTNAVASLRLGVIGVDTATGRDFRPGKY
jgi:polynucleotide 5'-hydroxyl-kinase GRC3/NOL9